MNSIAYLLTVVLTGSIAVGTAADRPEKPTKPEKPAVEKPAKPEKPTKPEKPAVEKPAKPEKLTPCKPDRPAHNFERQGPTGPQRYDAERDVWVAY